MSLLSMFFFYDDVPFSTLHVIVCQWRLTFLQSKRLFMFHLPCRFVSLVFVTTLSWSNKVYLLFAIVSDILHTNMTQEWAVTCKTWSWSKQVLSSLTATFLFLRWDRSQLLSISRWNTNLIADCLNWVIDASSWEAKMALLSSISDASLESVCHSQMYM